MNLTDFAEIVSKMRALQKEYAKTRDANTFKKCKELEKEVDAILERLEEYKKGQSLF